MGKVTNKSLFYGIQVYPGLRCQQDTQGNTAQSTKEFHFFHLVWLYALVSFTYSHLGYTWFVSQNDFANLSGIVKFCERDYATITFCINIFLLTILEGSETIYFFELLKTLNVLTSYRGSATLFPGFYICISIIHKHLEWHIVYGGMYTPSVYL